MPLKDIPFDPAKRAEHELNSVIDKAHVDDSVQESITIVDEKLKARQDTLVAETERLEEESLNVPDMGMDMQEERIIAKEARTAAPVLEYHSDRNDIRLLLFTRDITILTEGSVAQKRALEFASAFLELHIVVLNVDRKEDAEAVRIANNAWIYRTNSRSWWRTPFDARRIANEQLTFAGGFRADIVIAEDPFESGVAGALVAGRQERPLQVHVLDDFYDPLFKEHDENNWLRAFAAHFVLGRAQSVRTKSDFLKDTILDEHHSLKDSIEVLPIYHDLEIWQDMTPSFDLHERYPQFKFIILHISTMTTRSHTQEVIIGSTPMLKRYPTMGLVIVGSGPLRANMEKLVIMLGIQNQVEFEPTPNEYASHMKSANILVHLSEDAEEDEVVLAAASVRLPMIVGEKGLGGDLFKHNESALICGNRDTNCVAENINKYLNQNQVRAAFALNAHDIVFDRIKQDYGAYLTAYRESIERGIVTPVAE